MAGADALAQRCAALRTRSELVRRARSLLFPPLGPFHEVARLLLRRPLLTSACFFVLGIGTLLPWSSSVVTLPWIAAAARHAPTLPQGVLDGLLGAVTLAFSLTNTVTVFTVARANLAARLPPAAQVPAPLLACALFAAAASAAAHADAGGSPLSGRTVVSFAMPAAVVQGALTALLNCGGAAMAAPRPAGVMRAYTSGQALAGLAASTGAFLAAAAAAPGQSKTPGDDDAAALAALARHASWAFGATSLLLVLCLSAYVMLRRMAAPAAPAAPQEAQAEREQGEAWQPRLRVEGFATADPPSSLTEPLLDAEEQADEAGAPDALAPLDLHDDDTRELTRYKVVRECHHLTSGLRAPPALTRSADAVRLRHVHRVAVRLSRHHRVAGACGGGRRRCSALRRAPARRPACALLLRRLQRGAPPDAVRPLFVWGFGRLLLLLVSK